ncbi:Bug family tripartite tricarboxylate transporter substrate binding protein [Cupriavidus basilensis]
MMQRNIPSVTRRAFIGACLALGFIAGAQAGDWPERPITLVVPYPAGGLTDTVSRTLGDEVGKILGQPVVIENRAGAGERLAWMRSGARHVMVTRLHWSCLPP